jgi:RNA polymerase primary sigma factor
MKQIRVGSDTIISRDINLERYLKDIRKAPILSRQEERDTILLAQAGSQAAFEKLIEANLRFVVSCAKEYQYPGVEIIDLISAGNVGLMEAVAKFDLSKEIKFISYAVWWIKNSIIEFLRENTKAIRLPYNQQNEIQKYYKEKDKLEKQYETNLNADQVGELNPEIDVDYIRQALACNQSAQSMNEPIGGGGEGEVGIVEDLVSDPNANFLEGYDHDFRKKQISRALGKLSTIQKQIIVLSFGLEDSISRSNEDIAEQLKLTAERIRQIKNQALEKLGNLEYLQACF